MRVVSCGDCPYVGQEPGNVAPATCPGCGAFGTLRMLPGAIGNPDRPPAAAAPRTSAALELDDPPRRCSEISLADEEARIMLPLPGVNDVLGGGLVPAQVVLLAGPPGVGKSTLLLQLFAGFPRVLYATAEETPRQVAGRAHRIGVDTGFQLMAQGDVGKVLEAAKELDIHFLLVDSINVTRHPDVASEPGLPNQVRACTGALLRDCKARGRVLVMLGQVTKDGGLAGPEVLQHMVDTVLELGKLEGTEQLILSCTKNRFGPTGRFAYFTMREDGLDERLGPKPADPLGAQDLARSARDA